MPSSKEPHLAREPQVPDPCFRVSIPSFSVVLKLTNAFPFFLRNNGRMSLTSGLAYGLVSAKSDPGYSKGE